MRDVNCTVPNPQPGSAVIAMSVGRYDRAAIERFASKAMRTKARHTPFQRQAYSELNAARVLDVGLRSL